MVYGAFAVVPIFLLWIYLLWLIVLGGAVLVAELPEWREHATSTRHAPGSDFFHALRALEMLWRARRDGRNVTTSMLHAGARLRIDRLEWVLAALARAGFITRVGPAGWALSAQAGGISLRELYRLFVFDLDSPAAGRQAPAGFESRLGALAEKGGAAMGLSLAEFFETADPAG
jgi:membrane protein